MTNNNPFIIVPGCIDNRAKLKGVLADIFPTERLKINIILAAYDEGIVDAINKAEEIDNILAGRFVKILVTDYGISEENARWALDYWFNNYGTDVLKKANNVKVEQRPLQREATPATVPKAYVETPPAGIVSVKDLKEDEKLPKGLIQRFVSEEQKLGITNFRCSIVNSYVYDRYVNLKITGEYTGKVSQYIVMMVIIFNANNEMIEACFNEKIDHNFNGKGTFSFIAQVPKDEYVSRIVVRFIPDPVFAN